MQSGQLPLTFQFSARTTLVDVQAVRAIRGIDAETVIAMLDNALHPGHLKFVFDLGQAGSPVRPAATRRRCLRFWIAEIVAPEFTARLTIDEALDSIIGARETWRRGEVEMQWVASAQQISKLIRNGELAEEGNRILGASLRNFLRRRWISSELRCIRRENALTQSNKNEIYEPGRNPNIDRKPCLIPANHGSHRR